MVPSLRVAAFLSLLLLYGSAAAHKPSDSYLTLAWNDTHPSAQWDIALRDLDYALGLDTDENGEVTWGELRSQHGTVADYVLSHLAINTRTASCDLMPGEQLVDHHSDGAYSVLHFAVDCPNGAKPAVLEYDLFFELDPTHRGLARIDYPDEVQTAVLSPEEPRLELGLNTSAGWRQVAQYWREGIHHIWIGIDHILFLVALLLPVGLVRAKGRWNNAKPFRSLLLELTGIVTAFTLAHSITLSAAVLGLVSLPARWVEAVIAATVLAVALHNLYPLLPGRRWMIAFGLGLVHGFGFASVLGDLGLPGKTLLQALLAFNLGVETGQLVIVMLLLPLLFLLRDTGFYRRAAMPVGSAVIGLIASAWLIQRSAGIEL